MNFENLINEISKADSKELQMLDEIYRVEEVSQRGEGGNGWKNSDHIMEDILFVREGAFAYLNKKLESDLGYKNLEALEIGPCVAVALIDYNGSVALAHLNGRKDVQVKYFVNACRNALNTGFDEAKAITLYPGDMFYECTAFLSKELGKDNVERIRGRYAVPSMSAGINRKEFYYPIHGPKKFSFPHDTYFRNNEELTDL